MSLALYASQFQSSGIYDNYKIAGRLTKWESYIGSFFQHRSFLIYSINLLNINLFISLNEFTDTDKSSLF